MVFYSIWNVKIDWYHTSTKSATTIMNYVYETIDMSQPYYIDSREHLSTSAESNFSIDFFLSVIKDTARASSLPSLSEF